MDAVTVEAILDVSRYLGNIAGAVVGIVFFFVSIGNYLLYRKPRHLIEVVLAALWSMIFIARTLSTTDPPLMEPQFSALTIAVSWLIFMILLAIWGAILINDQRKLMELQRIVAQKAEEIEHAEDRIANGN